MDAAFSAERVAFEICKKTDFTLTKLRLQKYLFLIARLHAAETGAPLLHTNFFATDFGPVQPQLDRSLAGRAERPLRQLDFPIWRMKGNWPVTQDLPASPMIATSVQKLSGRTAGDLVSLTHVEGGAWARHYMPGFQVEIPFQSILDEVAMLRAKAVA